jgi:DNA polymerase-4
MVRKIIHLDMDAFYASVEQRDDPTLRGRPVVVGGHPEGRGVVAAASYEARKFGIHSAMPISRAKKLCHGAVFLPTDMKKYSEVSYDISLILHRFTPLVEQIALDESFLDVTRSERIFGPAEEIAKAARRQIKEEVRLSASAGVAANKFLAKLASGLAKPDGLLVVQPDEAESFLKELPVSKIWGVGKVTEARLKEMGIGTISQLGRRPVGELQARFGKAGLRLFELAHGIDEEPVEPEGLPKSIGQEETFARDLDDLEALKKIIIRQCERVAARARALGGEGERVVVKVRFSNFATVTRQGPLPEATNGAQDIYPEALRQLARVDVKGKKVRLIGVTLTGLIYSRPEQLSLFAGKPEMWSRAEQTLDRIRQRFGDRALVRASTLDWDED